MVFFRVLEMFPPFVVSLLVMEILFCNVVVGSSFTCDVNDHEALMEFAGNLSNSRAVLSNWFSLPNCCDWDGVFCENFSESNSSTAGNVVKLDLGRRGFSGTVSSSLGRLVRLRYLDLSFGSLRGTVPAEVTSLGELEFLDLSFNGFTGSFHGGRLKSIQVINISSNSFDGSLVDSMMIVYPDLVFMNLSNNSFVGPIMSEICSRSPGVKVLDFSMNGFSGNVDRGFGNCSALIELSLGTNSLVGELPDDLFMASSLEKLSLYANGFSGRLSGAIGNLTKLNTLIIYGNGFSGNLPDVFGNLTKLEQIDAHSNLFNGSLPASLSSCSSLQTLVLRNNSLTGNIDLNFSVMANLTSLDLASNHFTGNLPSSLSYCKKLQTLTVAKNRLSGEIPEELAELDSLIFLSLSNNSFTNISTTLHVLQNCKSLGTLILTRNFKGELLPEDVTGFYELKLLAVGNCGLFGGVPAWLLNCKKLQILDLSWNHLSGNVPPWIGELDELFYLDLSNNSLTGEIPTSLTQLKSLVSMKGSTKGNSSMIIPVFVKRNQSASGLQYNQISSFPPSIYLCNNMLNGTLLPEFGRLRDLHVLDLSRNNITGTIPDTLSKMINLEILDLSLNDLFGAIPVSLNKLTFLSKFSVAYNHLVGPIPTGGQLFSFASSSFEGNTGLCGGPLPPCNSTIIAPLVNVPNSRNGRNTILGITISLGAGIVLLLIVLLLKMSRKDVINLADSEDMEIGYACSVTEDSGSKLVLLFQNPAGKELTIADILKATNNFDQANIIGCGGFGLVYKASLPEGTRVAIKRLSGDCGQMEREFRAEVEALSRAQHKNLVLLQGYCRHGDDRLLIYSYMENGSLDYWLHERLDSPTTLDWEARLKIASGAAYGLAYLHKSCVPNVVHRDVKSSNILLNERFEAHLADFGLSRLLKPYDTHVTTDLVGTLGYIPPEYSQTMTATFKGDVYSFGIVILELLTGKRPVDICKLKGCRDLVSWVRQMKLEMRDAEVFEPSIWNKENEKQLLEVLDVALKCVNVDPKQRPSIDQVVSWLDRVGNHDETIK